MTHLIVIVMLTLIFLSGCGASTGEGVDPVDQDAMSIEASESSLLSENALDSLSEFVADSHSDLGPRSIYTQRVNVVTEEIGSFSGREFEYFAVSGYSVDLQGLPDGRMYISRGLLDLLSNDEARAVILAEIAHINLGHTAARYSAAFSAEFPDSDGESVSGKRSRFLSSLARTKFTEAQEVAASSFAKEQLEKSNYSVVLMSDALEKLAALEGSHPWVSAHSGSESGNEMVGKAAKPSATATELSAKEMESVKTATLSLKNNTAAQTSKESIAPIEEAPVKEAPIEEVPVKEVTAEQEAVEVSDIPLKAQSETQLKTVKDNPPRLGITPGWYVQLAAEQEADLAEQKRDSLSAGGEKAVVQGVVVDGKRFYRLMLGPFSSRTMAQKKSKAMRGSSVARGKPFLKRIE